MYNKIVVPLDGSDLAEISLPHVMEIAKGCSVPRVILVSVTEEIRTRVSGALAAEGQTREYHMAPTESSLALGSSHTGIIYSQDPTAMKDVHADLGKMARTAWDYLAKKSAELLKEGVMTDTMVLVGHPAEQIINFADSEQADLIIMASRGKSGFGRWEMGNIADKVIRASTVPVLVVKPKPGFRETKKKRKGTAI